MSTEANSESSPQTPVADNPAANLDGKLDKPAKKQDAKAAKSKGSPFLALLVLLLIVAVSAMGYWGWMQQQSLLKSQDQLLLQLNKQQKRVGELQGLLQRDDDNSASELQSIVTEVDQRMQSMTRRLQSLESANRDDWLLAEAEYLLRLASQRLLMERGTSGALALMEAADKILRDLENDDLFAVRQQLARDMASVKLAPSVDRSGLYLQLAALSEQIEALPDLPGDMGLDKEPVPVAEAMLAETAQQSPGVWKELQQNFWEATATVGRYIRVRHHDQIIVPILPPESSAYLRQNIRLIIERAQLAMLRENSQVFQHSLLEAETLVKKYFATQDKAQLLAEELKQLAKTDVSVSLPDINNSLTALRDFINRQHKLSNLSDPAPSDKAAAL